MRLSRLTAVMAFALLALLTPASALAKQSLAISSPTGFPAGGDPTYTTNIALDSSAGTASTVKVSLAPGVLASPAANPSCVKSTQDTATCEIGTGSVSTSLGLSVPYTAYLAPPPSPDDVVGIDVVTDIPLLPVTHAGGQIVQTVSGNVQTVLSLSLSGLGSLAQFVTGMSLTVNGTLDGKPFNRMPTNCSPGLSTLTVIYTNQTETTVASPDITPTGCSTLPYSPRANATAHAVVHGIGAGTVVQTITQPAGQAASARTTLLLPKTALLPNIAAVKYQNTSTPVGSAVAASPLLPTPLRGHIFLKGTLQKPVLLFKFPPPAALTLTGRVNLSSDSVTIPVIPDVPLTRLQVTFPGGPAGMLVVGCPTTPAKLKGFFVAQSGKKASSTQTVTVKGCPGK